MTPERPVLAPSSKDEEEVSSELLEDSVDFGGDSEAECRDEEQAHEDPSHGYSNRPGGA